MDEMTAELLFKHRERGLRRREDSLTVMEGRDYTWTERET